MLAGYLAQLVARLLSGIGIEIVSQSLFLLREVFQEIHLVFTSAVLNCPQESLPLRIFSDLANSFVSEKSFSHLGELLALSALSSFASIVRVG